MRGALLVALLALGLIALAGQKQLERFADAGGARGAAAASAPWERRPISTSVDADPVVKYPKAYYSELGNGPYLAALQGLFQLSCEIQREAERDLASWPTGPVPPERALAPHVKEAYDAAVWHIGGRVQSAAGALALALPDASDAARVQMVYDTLAEYGVGPVNAAAVGADGPPNLRLTVECVFYRFGKFHGKHVQFVVRAIPELTSRTLGGGNGAPVPTWKIVVLGLRILGVVSADHIGLYPVEARDPAAPDALPVPTDVIGPKATYPTTLLDENETLAILMEQQRRMQAYLEAEGAVAGYATVGETLS